MSENTWNTIFTRPDPIPAESDSTVPAAPPRPPAPAAPQRAAPPPPLKRRASDESSAAPLPPPPVATQPPAVPPPQYAQPVYQAPPAKPAPTRSGHRPVVPLRQMLQEMIDRDASDLYLSTEALPKFSLHGGMTDAASEFLTPEDTLAYAEEMMSDDLLDEFHREMEVNLSYAMGEDGRFRVNVFTQRGSAALVIRRIKTVIPRLEDLGLPAQLGELIMGERGLLLMTGATGSGKSTTLASMIDYRNANMGGHIITIEDPVEFVHPNKMSLVNQREVGIDTKSFHIALKNTLRQAPKVIYIGEIRDQETMEFALHAAETGHLVLATLHSNNANQTLERIQNFFPQEYHRQLLLQLSLNLRAILSQRLIPKIGGGRAPALEILLNTPYISELILKGDITGVKTAMSAAKQEGTQTFDQDLLRLWEEKKITEEEALKYADSPNNLRLRMRGIR